MLYGISAVARCACQKVKMLARTVNKNRVISNNNSSNKLINSIKMLMKMLMLHQSCRAVQLSVSERSAGCRHANISWVSGYQTQNSLQLLDMFHVWPGVSSDQKPAGQFCIFHYKLCKKFFNAALKFVSCTEIWHWFNLKRFSVVSAWFGRYPLEYHSWYPTINWAVCVCSVSDPSGLCRHGTHHDRKAPQPGERHRVVVEESEHALLGHRLHQRGDARGGREEVPCHSHQGETHKRFYIVLHVCVTEVFILLTPAESSCISSNCFLCNPGPVIDTAVVCVLSCYPRSLIVCVVYSGPARLVWAETREGQQGHHSIKHHVHCGPVSSLPPSPLEVPQDCRQQAVWVHARWETEETRSSPFP